MLSRFKPIELFPFDVPDVSRLVSVMEGLAQDNLKKKAAAWRVFREHYNDILAISKWVLSNSNSIRKVFPSLGNGDLHKNRHLLVKEFAKSRSSSGTSMFSHGFEGANYRLVVASNNARQLFCMYGEYLNLSGKILNFRQGYPEKATCELCSQVAPHNVCIICGRWFCNACSTYCSQCNKTICKDCSSNDGILKYSAHDWYFHKDEE